MNLLKTIFAFGLLSVAFTGCDQIDEDLTACEGEAVIHFDYPYNGQMNYFLDHIDNVKAYIFKVENGVLVEDRFIPRDSLEAFQGMKVNLPVGEYKAVFWGDAEEHTTIDWHRQLTYNPLLFDEKAETDQTIHTDDDLDYSQITFQVVRTPDPNKVDTAHFEPAYIKFFIDVMMPQGLSADYIPAIAIGNLNTEIYDFNMQPSNANDDDYTFYPTHTLEPNHNTARRTRVTVPATPEEGGYELKETEKGMIYVLATSTLTHRLANDNPVKIKLYKNSAMSGNPIQTLNLSEFMAQHNIYIEPKKECTISITFVIGLNGEITIQALPWEKVGVDPIFPNIGDGTSN
ncbi:MAG: FimB/Mfa2 family fimbrial subunit [Prevotellaceae bacterium]|jgi:hypothetical protein|nr:FimB/Mfa2 family fimbrial subunit [Prevotellaceae bacterium]